MTAQEALKNYISSIEWGNRGRVKAEIALKCGVTPTTVDFWIMGRAKIRTIYRREINRIASRNLFENVTD